MHPNTAWYLGIRGEKTAVTAGELMFRAPWEYGDDADAVARKRGLLGAGLGGATGLMGGGLLAGAMGGGGKAKLLGAGLGAGLGALEGGLMGTGAGYLAGKHTGEKPWHQRLFG
jgi:hypothetical protein